MENTKKNCSIQNIRKLTSNVLEFTLQLNEDFEFTAGQFLTVHFEHNGAEIKRCYSIASGPENKRELVLIVKLLEGEERKASRYFEKLQTGDELTLSGPAGKLVLEESEKEVLMIATGTGIVPFLSMLKTELPRSKRRFQLFWGLRYSKDIFYQDVLQSWKENHPNFNYEITISRTELDAWQGKRGRVSEHVKQLTDLQAKQIYLCGNPEMVNEILSYLDQQGKSREELHFEAY
ncbi:MAG: FAD-binding oxidoreductase [Candidatus Gracilibacteria bacterium]|nr:FAD-binding oxidoreductase [Candidatus Gracilibacteria bacterium]